MKNEKNKSLDFIRRIVERDNETGKYDNRVHTRFPPEPNGYLHIGHAKAICLDFDIASENDGKCNLRFDDTNPLKEEQAYIDSIQEDVNWLNYDWDKLCFASEYFEQLYKYALQLIEKGKAYVDSSSESKIRRDRGTVTKAGKNSPYRDRSVKENLALFEQMKNGEFKEGEHVLRAKIDMSAPNMLMRDPIIYRIRYAEHYRTGDKWCIYPMYDFTHCLSDSIEHITHSLCTLEFENNRALYDWFLDELDIYHSHQIEFARLNINYTILSKRKLAKLVESGLVEGWDDPRMPTLSGLRRRGYTPEAIKEFIGRIGVAKKESVVDLALLEYCIKDDLNKRAPRKMGVLRPLKVVITNYPENDTEELEAVNNPEDPSAGKRKVPFSREIYIERSDFMEDPPKKFWRLGPGREVRLRWAYFIKCHDYKTDENGNVEEIYCTYDPATKGGSAPDGRKVKATLHWVSVPHAENVEVRLYDRLFDKIDPNDVKEGEDFTANLNPNSLQILDNCAVEPSLKNPKPGYICQFERKGYFCVDTKESTPDNPVFNRIVPLRDQWKKIQKRQAHELRMKKQKQRKKRNRNG